MLLPNRKGLNAIAYMQILRDTSKALSQVNKHIFQNPTDALLKQKHTLRFKTSTSHQCPLCYHSDSALHILSDLQRQTISSMITERHNIACRLLIKAIKAGSLGGCFAKWVIGSKDRLALQNLQIPEGSTDQIVPEWLFPCQFPSKQRLTTSRPDAILVTEMPTIKAQKLPNFHPRYALESRAGCRGDRGLSATAPACQPSSSVRNPSQLPPR